ncbi:MAG: ATP-grasp domain-containing protein [Nitrospinaceae bacterium]|jgi:carbamoyl-phosphate synthase large subunit|nr:ATP-grasp domain-containing protein [Nitrospinaceae bacterium]
MNPNDPFPGFPLTAKESCGEGRGGDSFMIENQADLDFYSKKLPNHIFQRFVQGREFSIDWFSDKNGVPAVTVPRELLAVHAGEVMMSRIELDLDIIESAKKVGTLLQLRGPANLQGILDESGKFLFTDINLRFGSGAVHSIQARADIPGMIFQELAGGSIENKSNSVTNGSTMSRFHDALYDS